MPGKVSYASAAVLLDVSRRTRDLGSNVRGLSLAGAGGLAPFGGLWDANCEVVNAETTVHGNSREGQSRKLLVEVETMT